MAKWLAKEFDWDTGKYTGNYYDIAEAGIVAVFVDSFYGLDTNAGTAAAPFKTLDKAIQVLNTTGADGSRIFMNGIFSENLPTQTYWYQLIGCGGGKNGRTIFYMNPSTFARVVFTKTQMKCENIETLFYEYNNVSSGVGGDFDFYCLNCIFRKCMFHVRYGSSNFLYCKIIDCWSGVMGGTGGGSYNNTKSVIIDWNKYPYENSISYLGSLISNYSFLRNIIGTKSMIGCVLDIEAQFINEADNDFNVRITSPLLGAGPVDEISGNPTNIGGVSLGLPYNGLIYEFSETGGATITDLTLDATGKYTITAPATSGTLETALMDLGNIYPLENIDLFNVFDFLSGEITQGVFEYFVSPRMALTIKLKYGLAEAEVDECPWLLIEYGKQPTFSGTGASRVGNADATFDPDTFQEITCRYMKLFVTLQNNS